MRRKWRLAFALAGTAMMSLHAAAVEKPEELTTAKMPAYSPHQVYVIDANFPSMTDGRVYVVNGDDGKLLGQIDGGFSPGLAISPDHKTTYIATTYFARGSHGARTDVVESTDNTTLQITGEVVIPAKHGQQTPTPYNTALSTDGKWLYVANITPATSVTVINLAAHRVTAEIDTDGCVLAYPSGNDRFTAMCESGKGLTITLANGKEKNRKLSEAFIDVDKDPAFVNAVRDQNTYWFTTFNGNVRTANFAGAAPVFGKSWALVTADEQKAGWRPGGLQQTALHTGTQRLFVLMHQGGEGSHKEPATEIWVFDVKAQKRVARWKLADQKIDPLLAVQVSQDAHPLLYGITTTSDVVIADATTGKLKTVQKQIGATSSLLVNP
ncbi:amine dehydrogenase large subunit [Paraburkholderia saeva]|uniref:Aralkylamine dehydrogenase heavy chain n=1 Tax=Paraburkholderia saeva TaxID=2777537 RepID=A0A9N8RZ47_9BURK|nr:amine dehydrogenase large subunit [Paraburkholderia saeva]CAG4906090.1 Aralkylamine dehydrogenase heavy chain [Paraburkholderia saeva]CAG4910047.1 Aralkylamine dehydrogenase heavy chain [Paraburkholderia saeva]